MMTEEITEMVEPMAEENATTDNEIDNPAEETEGVSLDNIYDEETKESAPKEPETPLLADFDSEDLKLFKDTFKNPK